ncbi:hypothetical protein MHUMG1_04390 [Metarhizium humberi]|uniref:Uncharacterized protein n=1 Tax=Metarhizium humberi TaxID=2596975 RepID=A0A9P8MCR0_9HYPO|nr:hypothetical protein MHUMG1_04390 [Metarhizium humberi]
MAGLHPVLWDFALVSWKIVGAWMPNAEKLQSSESTTISSVSSRAKNLCVLPRLTGVFLTTGTVKRTGYWIRFAEEDKQRNKWNGDSTLVPWLLRARRVLTGTGINSLRKVWYSIGGAVFSAPSVNTDMSPANQDA